MPLLIYRNPKVEAHLNDFMESLQSLDGLTKVKLSVSSLTENWSERIASLVQRCPSLKDVRYKIAIILFILVHLIELYLLSVSLYVSIGIPDF